jgi:CRP-like cAMP-binding protein
MEPAPTADPYEAAVVSCGILDHSTMSSVDQIATVKAVNEVVADAIDRCPVDTVVWTYSGDGGHVVFQADEWQADAVRLIRKLSNWSQTAKVALRITGHFGRITEIKGADGRVQVVGNGINYAGWLLKQVSNAAVVVSDHFRRMVVSTDLVPSDCFHDERLFVARDLSPQLLYLMSLPDFKSSWMRVDQGDYAALERCMELGDGWGVLYFAKRMWQANSTDERVVEALDRTAQHLRSAGPESKNFFESLRPDELGDMLRLGQLVERKPGDLICKYGDPGGSLFVILRGEVGVYNIEGEGFGSGATPKDVHRTGEIVGELAYIFARSRTADLVALTDVALLAFDNEDMRQRLSASSAGHEAAHQLNLFTTVRVLEYAIQTSSYLLGPNRTGPLSHGERQERSPEEAERNWRRALRTLKTQCDLITIDSAGLELTFDDVVSQVDDPHGLYILVAGEVRRAAPGIVLDGLRCSVLWVDLPNLITRPPVSYDKATDVIKVLRIRNEGVNKLMLYQREALSRALDRKISGLPVDYEYDVYLCHSSQDKPVVEQIRDRFRAVGITCWFDNDELLPTDVVRSRIERGLLSSRYLVVCASRNFSASAWANRELDSILHLEVKRPRDAKVIVLKLNEEDGKDESIPLLLRGNKRLHYERPGDFDRLVDFLKSPAPGR